MQQELILCIPGPWESRADLVHQSVLLDPPGSYMFAGGILAHPSGKDHVPLDFCDPHENMARAFEVSGQGKIPSEILQKIATHHGVVYLHFPIEISEQRERVLKFTEVLHRLGGYGVKVESSGVSHEWDRWFSLLSGDPVGLYCSVITLVEDTDCYYSCGMHHFGLPEAAVPNSLTLPDAADLIHQFNYWRITRLPVLESGHTFSATDESSHFRMAHAPDTRHDDDDLFHNPHGIWNLSPA